MVDFSNLKKALSKNKEIGQVSVKLPSDKDRTAIIRPMKVKEQREILKALEKKDEFLVNEAFDQILDNCVISVDGEPFDIDELIVQDRTYLLIKIRQASTGNEAKISHICPKSGTVVKDIPIDLETLEVVYKDDVIELEKELSVTGDVKISLSAVTRKQEKELDRWLKKNKKQESVVDKRYAAYATVIGTVKILDEETNEYEELKTTFEQKIDLINMLSHNNLKEINEYLKSLDFGIKLRFHFKSDEYENENEEANIVSFFIM